MADTTLSYQRLEDEVFHLPQMDRSQLTTRLLESLEEDENELSPEWREELQRRVANIDAGKATLIPAVMHMSRRPGYRKARGENLR